MLLVLFKIRIQLISVFTNTNSYYTESSREYLMNRGQQHSVEQTPRSRRVLTTVM